jgi:hypothetical protein
MYSNRGRHRKRDRNGILKADGLMKNILCRGGGVVVGIWKKKWTFQKAIIVSQDSVCGV